MRPSVPAESARRAFDGTATVRVRIHDDVVAQQVDDEIVIVHLETNQIFRLSLSASRLWALLAAGRDVSEAREALLHEFEVPAATLESDIVATLASLALHRVIELDILE